MMRLSLMEVLALLWKEDTSQNEVAHDLAQSIHDDVEWDPALPTNPIDPDWVPNGYGLIDD